jgi:hypothetical protein
MNLDLVVYIGLPVVLYIACMFDAFYDKSKVVNSGNDGWTD